jgi:transposase
MRPSVVRSSGPVSLSPSQSCPACTTNTSGYDFRKGQAEEFGVSRERVRQIEVSAFEKVQNAVKHRVAAMGTPAPLQVR